MSALYLLIAVSVAVAICFLCAFIWSTGDGQYDDDTTPAIRVLFDNETSDNEELHNK